MTRPSTLRRILALALGLPALAGAAQLSPSSYSYSHSPSGSYPDSGGELTNGITFSAAWTVPATSIGPEDVVQLVGWQNTSPTVTFSFAAPVTIRTVTVWFADSDGSAGVGVPGSVTLSDGGSFLQNFPITDPAGNGSTVAFTFTGFATTTDTLAVTFHRDYQWTMASEVQFFDTSAIPEPSSFAMAVGAAALGCGLGRRRPRAVRAGNGL